MTCSFPTFFARLDHVQNSYLMVKTKGRDSTSCSWSWRKFLQIMEGRHWVKLHWIRLGLREPLPFQGLEVQSRRNRIWMPWIGIWQRMKYVCWTLLLRRFRLISRPIKSFLQRRHQYQAETIWFLDILIWLCCERLIIKFYNQSFISVHTYTYNTRYSIIILICKCTLFM